jgi:hypothetical protein
MRLITFLQYLRFCPAIIALLVGWVLFLAVTRPIDFIVSKVQVEKFS